VKYIFKYDETEKKNKDLILLLSSFCLKVNEEKVGTQKFTTVYEYLPKKRSLVVSL